MEVIGKQNLKFSFSILMSPGRCPSQVSLFPAKRTIIPARIKMPPVIMSIFPKSGISDLNQN